MSIKMKHRDELYRTPDNSSLDLYVGGFLRIRQVLAIFPVSRASWWAGVRSGKYPKPVKLGPNMTAWRVEDIRNLIERISKEAA